MVTPDGGMYGQSDSREILVKECSRAREESSRRKTIRRCHKEVESERLDKGQSDETLVDKWS